MSAEGAPSLARWPRPGVARAVDYVVLGVSIAIMLVIPHHIGADGELRYRALDELLRTGRAEPIKYSLVMPLFASPLWLLGRALGDPRAITALASTTFFFSTLVLLARELRRDTAAETRRALVLLLVHASMFPNHLTVFYGEVFTACAVTLGVFWLGRGRDGAGWAAIVVGAANTPATLVGVAAISICAAVRTRRLRHLLGPAAAFAALRVESLVARGELFATGYEHDAGFKSVLPYSGLPGFSYPLVLGVLGLTLSFGKGLFFFAPGLFVRPAPEPTERLAWVRGTLVAFLVGLILVYGRWWAWYGGSFWGPRFVLVASVPAAMTLATHVAAPAGVRSLSTSAAALAAVLFSFWVGVSGLIFDQTGLGVCSDNDYALEALCFYAPEYSVLFHPFVDLASAIPAKTRALGVAVCAYWMLVGSWTSREIVRDVLRGVRSELASWRERLRTGAPR